MSKPSDEVVNLAAEVLNKFLKYDSEGTFLTQKGNKYLQDLTQWDGEALGGEGISVIHGYQVRYLGSESNVLNFQVTYNMIGLASTMGYQKETNPKNYVFKLRQFDGKWKIFQPVALGFVSVDFAIEYINQLLVESNRTLEECRNALPSK